MTDCQKANIKSEAYGSAIIDATKAIELDPNFVKVRQHSLGPASLQLIKYRHTIEELLLILRSSNTEMP